MRQTLGEQAFTALDTKLEVRGQTIPLGLFVDPLQLLLLDLMALEDPRVDGLFRSYGLTRLSVGGKTVFELPALPVQTSLPLEEP